MNKKSITRNLQWAPLAFAALCVTHTQAQVNVTGKDSGKVMAGRDTDGSVRYARSRIIPRTTTPSLTVCYHGSFNG